MKQFKLCLLAVFMLLLSNCVTEYAVGTTELHSHYDTPQSAIKNKHKRMLHSHTIQRYALGSQAKVMSGEQGELGKGSQVKDGQATENGKEPSGSGESKPVAGDTGSQGNREDTSHSSGTPKAGSEANPVTQQESPGLTDVKQGSTTDAIAGAGDGSKTSAGQKPKKEDNSAPDVSATESTTTEPAAEGDRTEGSSDPTSTTTHSPTETVKGSDSQALVKAGALSFILTISTVLAIIM